MSNEVSKAEAKEIRALSMVKEAIAHIREIERDAQSMVKNALAVGKILNKQKELLRHGQFIPFVEQHYPKITDRTARRWMRAAEVQAATKAKLHDGLTLAGLLNVEKATQTTDVQVVKSDTMSDLNGQKPPENKGEIESAINIVPPSEGEVAVDDVVDVVEVVEEVEVDEWEYNAAAHQDLVDAINAFGRFLTEVMKTAESSEYIRHVETRLRSDMRQLKTTVWQNMPVGCTTRGRIITRNEEQAKKKA